MFTTQRRDMYTYKIFCIAVLAVVLSVLILNQFTSLEKLSFKKSPLISKREILSENISENKTFNKNFVILWYSIPFWLKSFSKDIRRIKCKDVISNCTLSTDNSDLNKSNVVIFTHFTLPKSPPINHTSQIWIFNTLENKQYTHWPSSAWKNKFEWIMSYHRDSDVSRPYGKIIPLNKSIDRNYSEVFRQKTHFGVWMATHCPTPSHREKYIKELQKYVAIDTYGACGKKKCGVRNPNMNECLNNFSKEYKFLFSFENSICRDYSTEKVFNLYAYNLSIIPVVNGPPQASEYLPNGTFINALDFPSPESLAKKLKEIGSNETLYTQYLKEKDKYTSLEQSEIFRETMCTVCKNLEQFGEQKISINPNLMSVYKGGC